MTKIEQAGPVTVGARPPQLTPEQQARAVEISVRAFLDDLAACCAATPAVLMFDAYEKCVPDLQHWLLAYFLEPHFFNFDARPQRLLLVIAGREVPDFELHWSAEDCQATVKSVRGLSQWRREHVAECLRGHGFEYAPHELDFFYQMIEMGYTPSETVNAIETYVRRRQL